MVKFQKGVIELATYSATLTKIISGVQHIIYPKTISSLVKHNNTTLEAILTASIGASASAAGNTGLVPAPAKGDQGKFLRGDGQWANMPETYVHPTYTATTGAESTNQSVVLGSSVNVSQVTSDTSGHVTGQTTRTITFTHPAYTATSGAEAAAATPGWGSTVNVSKVTSDATGHVSGQTTCTIKIPNSAMGAATADAAGSIGLVPAPAKGDQYKFLRADGTWAVAQTHSTDNTNSEYADFVVDSNNYVIEATYTDGTKFIAGEILSPTITSLDDRISELEEKVNMLSLHM